MQCLACGGETPDGKRYCANCGLPLTALCVSCGAELLGGKPFCADCGTPVAGVPAPPAGRRRRRRRPRRPFLPSILAGRRPGPAISPRLDHL